MPYSDISICSNALLKIGANCITSFEDGTAEAEIASALYGVIRDGMLSSFPWSFAKAQIKLPRLSSEPVADYSYAYQLPTDFLRVISAGSGTKGSGIDYRIHEDKLHTNYPEVILTYIFRPEESSFPAFFVDALITNLAAEFCSPLTESTSRSEYLHKLATESITKARLIDSQQSTPQCFEDFTLVESRI